MIRRSWLVQRLQKPRAGGNLAAFAEAFSFGGGLRNGGLSEDAMSLLRPIFSFDYMGSAEFEFGAVPKALDALAKDSRLLRPGVISVAFEDVAKPYRPEDPSARWASKSLYLLARGDDLPEVEARVRAWAGSTFIEAKEQPRLSAALRPSGEWDTETIGWFELDNGFFAFTDETAWRSVCSLFGVQVRDTHDRSAS